MADPEEGSAERGAQLGTPGGVKDQLVVKHEGILRRSADFVEDERAAGEGEIVLGVEGVSQLDRAAFGSIVGVKHQWRKEQRVLHLAEGDSSGKVGRSQRCPLSVGLVNEDAFLAAIVLHRLVVGNRVNAAGGDATIEVAGAELEADLEVLLHHGGEANARPVAPAAGVGEVGVVGVEAFVAATKIAVDFEGRHPVRHAGLGGEGGGEILIALFAQVVGFLDSKHAFADEFVEEGVHRLRSGRHGGSEQGGPGGQRDTSNSVSFHSFVFQITSTVCGQPVTNRWRASYD